MERIAAFRRLARTAKTTSEMIQRMDYITITTLLRIFSEQPFIISELYFLYLVNCNHY